MGKMSAGRNFFNFSIMIGVTLPPVLLVAAFHKWCDFGNMTQELADKKGLEYACSLYYNHPIISVNLFYLVFVDIGFWLVYLAQDSTWLIDPHWQIIPLCISWFYFTHPLAVHSARAWITLSLVALWAARLMHNYLRREEWQFGDREDWRYADMREKFGPKLWCLISFFAVSVAQHPMLVGMTLALCPAMVGASVPLGPLDFVACAFCVFGIVFGFVADNQLYAYMGQGASKPMILETGLWRYSRHPNHFGEQMWWVGLAFFGVSATSGAWWPFLGVLYNHPIDIFATLPLIEERMLKREERRELYKAYQARTSLVFPLPPKKEEAEEEEEEEEDQTEEEEGDDKNSSSICGPLLS